LDKIRGEEETRNKLKLSIANVEKNLDSIRSGLNAPVSTRPDAHLVSDAESRVKFHLKAQATGKKSDIDRLTEQLDKIRGEEETRNKLKLSIANVEKNLDSIRTGLNAPVSTRPDAHLVADAESRVKFHEQLKNIRAQADIQKKLAILHLDYLSYSYYCPN